MLFGTFLKLSVNFLKSLRVAYLKKFFLLTFTSLQLFKCFENRIALRNVSGTAVFSLRSKIDLSSNACFHFERGIEYSLFLLWIFFASLTGEKQ